MKETKQSSRNPWAWVPTLYFAEGIPYVVVMTVSVIMYKRLGISNTDIALYTSWLYLPWVIKPLWSPFVEMVKTKRFWIVALQLVIGIALAGVAFTIPMSHFFQLTLAIFWLMAFASATHDIAADGFYMLALPQHQQASFTGVRSTFYRVAMITGQGLLVVLAGVIETSSSLPSDPLQVDVRPVTDISMLLPVDTSATQETSGMRIVTTPSALVIPLATRPKGEVDSIVATMKRWNLRHGFTPGEEKKGATDPGWWSRDIGQPLEHFLREHFAEQKDVAPATLLRGNLGLISVRLSHAPAEGENRVVVLERTSGDKSVKVIEGERLVFTTANWNKSAVVVLQTDANLRSSTTATFLATSGNIPLAWTVTMTVLAVMFLLFFLYHRFMLPYPVDDHPAPRTETTNPLKEFFTIFSLFFQKKGIVTILAFLLLYRFAEAQLVKLVSPFLLDPRRVGGLGLTTSEVGIVYGTVGIIALTIGGLLGGYVVSKHGLRFWLWPMVLIIHLPDLMFVYLSHVQPDSFLLINAAVAIEQFGYGFGFTAYMLFMILVASGEHKTAHYAICTGFMALGMMLPGMFSGALQEIVGYRHFFIWVILSTIPGFIVAALVKIPEGFGKKERTSSPEEQRVGRK
jgi:MFS transporter, PAT family, beta-lactamase induction signal transducer AmpG